MLSADSISMDMCDIYSGRSLVELTCSAKISNKFTLRFRIQSISGCKPAEKVSSTYFNLKLAIKMLSEMIDKNIEQHEWPKLISFSQKLISFLIFLPMLKYLNHLWSNAFMLLCRSIFLCWEIQSVDNFGWLRIFSQNASASN